MIIKRAVETEKWIGKIEFENTIVFEVLLEATKYDVKKEMERLFKVKTQGIRTMIKDNKKYAIVKFGKDTKAEDIAAKLKMV